MIRTRGVGIDEGLLEEVTTVSRAEARKELGIDNDTFLVLSIGELIPRKRCDVAIEAVGKICGKRTLLLLGDGPERDQLQSVIVSRTEGQDEFHARCEGSQSDVRKYLTAADCLVHTALQEGQGLVILEAMAMGVPVVAFSVRGPRELLGNDRGLLAEPGDAAALVPLLQRVRDERVTLKDMTRRARSFAMSFSRAEQARKFAETYVAVCAARERVDRRVIQRLWQKDVVPFQG